MLFCNFYYAEILRLPAIIFRKGKEGAPSTSCTASRGTAAASGMVTPRHPHRAGVLVHLLDESFGEHVFNGFGESLRGNEMGTMATAEQRSAVRGICNVPQGRGGTSEQALV